MSEPSHPLTDEMLDRAFDGLGPDDRDAIRDALSETEIDPETDASVDALLRGTASLDDGDVPPIPASALALFEKNKSEALAEVAREEAELDSSIYSKPRRYADTTGEKVSFFSRFKLPIGIAGVAAAAAAVAIGVFWTGGTGGIVAPVYAEKADLLTPGPTTGFSEPVFTWESGNGGAATLEVAAADGTTVARLENAYSPVRWKSIPGAGQLEPGAEYRIQISTPETMLAEQSFQLSDDAEASPVPADSLDGIVEQCESLLAANRAADAWMLWAELTASEKSDPRMQELKTRILQQIAG